jgi:hypothetical protein
MDIDDFLKQSVGQTEFDMKDAYWQSASALLDRHYKKRMWIRRGIYTSVFLLLLGGVGVIWQLQRQIPVSDKPSIPTKNIGSQGDFANKNMESNEISHRTSQMQPAVASEAAENIATAPKHPAGLDAADRKNTLNSTNHEVVNNVHREESTPSFRDENSANSEASKNPGASGKTEATGLNEQNGETVDFGVDALVAENRLANTDKKDASKKETFIVGSDAELNSMKEDDLARNILELLPLSDVELNYPALDIEESLPKRVDPSRFNPYWEYLVFAQMLTFPKLEPSSKKVLGGQAGVEFRYSFHKNWFLRGGLAAGVRNGSFAPSFYSTQRTYFLGPQDDAYVTRPTSLWYLGTPLQLGYRKGRNAIMAGITPQWLMGVYGNLEYARENLRQPVSDEDLYAFEKLESGWMSRGGMRRMIMTYTFSFSRQVHPRVHLGMTLQAIPSDWVSDQYGQKYDFSSQSYLPAELDQRALVEKNWILSFNVHYRL